MASKRHLKLNNFGGVNRAVSERDDTTFLKTCINFDTNTEAGKLVSRKGYTSKVDLAAANIDQIFEYRDEEWGKDVLLVYDKNATVGSRKIYVYTRTSGSGSSYAQQGSYDYGSVEFGDRLGFLAYRGGVRIGTGTGAANKALTGKYYDRTGDNAMFDGNIEFSGWFLHKQQWVQQADMFAGARAFEYDATRESFYILTTRGLEIRDSNLKIVRILEDVQAYQSAATTTATGGVALNGDTLVVCGKVPGSLNSKIMVYDIADNYSSSYSVTYTSTDEVYKVATDGTNIFAAAYVSSAYLIQRYTMALASATTIYTAGGSDKFVTGLSADSTATTGYCYCAENDGNDIHKFLKDGTTSYDTTKIATTTDAAGVKWYANNVYFIAGGDIKVTPDSLAGSITTKKTGTYNYDIILPAGVPYALESGLLHKFDNVTDFNTQAIYPGLCVVDNAGVLTKNSSNSYFYGISLIDVYGQESHLMTGFAFHATSRSLYIDIRADIGLYDEQGLTDVSASYDPTEESSVWNNLRQFKAIRIYRAYNADAQQANPTSNYRFLGEVEFTDSRWVEITANKRYQFVFFDNIPESDISSVTFEESAGLPETFKPYYVNWQHARQMGQFFYYGNFRANEFFPQRIIETPALAPDTAYLTDTNFADFGLGDGDGIQGLETSWNRLAIFKGEKTGIFNGLNQELVYQIGTNSPDSIVAWNNYVYFTYGSSIYRLNPSGFERISKPVDELLASETVTGTVAAVFKDKEKIWFLMPGNTSYLFNYALGTWDVYEINNGDDSHVFIATASDGNILTANSNDDKVYLQNSGTQDNGQNIALSFETNDLPLGGGFMNANIYRMFVTFTSAADLTIQLAYRNENGAKTVSKTFTLTTANLTRHRFLSGVYGQHCSFAMASYPSATEVRIDDLGIEYSVTADRLQNA